MEACALTDTGQKRSMNQDFIYASTDPVGSLENLFIVADGMGGHQAGDFASRFVVENLVRFFEIPHPDRDVHGILKEGIRKVNRELYKQASRTPELDHFPGKCIRPGKYQPVWGNGGCRMWGLYEDPGIWVPSDHLFCSGTYYFYQSESGSKRI